MLKSGVIQESKQNAYAGFQRDVLEYTQNMPDEQDDEKADSDISRKGRGDMRSCPSPAVDILPIAHDGWVGILGKSMTNWTCEEVQKLYGEDKELVSLCKTFEINGNLLSVLLTLSDLLALNPDHAPIFSIQPFFNRENAARFLEVRANILQESKRFQSPAPGSTGAGSLGPIDSVRTESPHETNGSMDRLFYHPMGTGSDAASIATGAIVQSSESSLNPAISSKNLSTNKRSQPCVQNLAEEKMDSTVRCRIPSRCSAFSFRPSSQLSMSLSLPQEPTSRSIARRVPVKESVPRDLPTVAQPCSESRSVGAVQRVRDRCESPAESMFASRIKTKREAGILSGESQSMSVSSLQSFGSTYIRQRSFSWCSALRYSQHKGLIHMSLKNIASLFYETEGIRFISRSNRGWMAASL